MSESLEIEFKNLLSEHEFNHLVVKFGFDASAFWSQTNYYFDTKEFLLKGLGCALRIREKKGKYEITLKQPTDNGVGLIETNQNINEEAAKSFIENGNFPIGVVSDKVIKLLPNLTDIACFGSMITERTEINYDNGLLVLDKSRYFDVVDYELEYEVQDFKTGEKSFYALLRSENIQIRKTLNKIKRFYDEMKHREDSRKLL